MTPNSGSTPDIETVRVALQRAMYAYDQDPHSFDEEESQDWDTLAVFDALDRINLVVEAARTVTTCRHDDVDAAIIRLEHALGALDA